MAKGINAHLNMSLRLGVQLLIVTLEEFDVWTVMQITSLECVLNLTFGHCFKFHCTRALLRDASQAEAGGLELGLAMSCSDSEAVFKARFLELGLTDAQYRLFSDEGLTTMGHFAFSCNYAPGGADERPLVTLVTKVLGAAPSTREMSCLRRLFSEAYSTIAAEIKSQVEASDDTVVKKLAPAERAQRLKDQQARLTGLELRGNYEPGDSLIDKSVAAYEADRLVYISWELCVSREHELLSGTKKDPSLSFDASGNLKLAKKDTAEPCSTSSEMHVRYCLTRTGLALEQANIISFRNHERLTEKLMNARLEEPPTGCVRLTMKQLEQADRKFWTLMSEHTRDGIKARAAGRPCDDKFDACIGSPEFLNLLQHRFAPPPTSQVPRPPKQTEGPKFKKPRFEGNAPKGAGKSFQRVPAELLAMGCVACTPKGHRLCFDANFKRCKLQVVDNKCSKGLHCVRSVDASRNMLRWTARTRRQRSD